MQDPSKWAEFGLAGMVILALFVALGTIVRWLIAHIDKQALTHRDERSEWRESSNQSNQKIETAVNNLTESIRGLKD